MESSTDTAAAAAAAVDSFSCTFSQVLFTDIPHSYPPATPVTCCYALTEAFQPNPRDWVGIFKVGWSTTKDYHTFVWVEPCQDVTGQQSVTKQAVFKDYYLPKDEIEFYQFCYVDSTGQVRGASTPFCFKSPVEQNMESSMDDDLLVITTQEQVEQSVREKAELMKELDQIREENETLKKALQQEQQEVDSLKEQNGQKEKEKSELEKELDQIKVQNANLKYNLQEKQQETDRLKEEILVQMAKQMEIQQQNADEQQKLKSQSERLDGASRQNEEKYDRAVIKINKMKEEREELRGKIEDQSDEIAKLNSKLREGERELFKMKDSIQLLQVDLQSSEKEKERLAAELQRLQSVTQNMDEVKRENQELCRRLSQQETQQQSSKDEDLKAQCQTLLRQLQEAQEKLVVVKEESKNTKTRAEFLERELQQVREQLDGVAMTCEQAQRKSGKQEMQLVEAHEAIADKDGIIEEKEHMIMFVRRENEELIRQNEGLRVDIEELRRVNADLHAAPPSSDSVYMQPDITAAAAAGAASTTQDWQQEESPEQGENLYETIESGGEPEEEQLLVCRHCQESFPGITQNELEQHEQSHRVCPFCTMICDNMEQSVFEDHVYSHEL